MMVGCVVIAVLWTVRWCLGMSETEQTLKGTSQIKILNAEEIEGMRVVCKVSPGFFSECIFIYLLPVA